MQGYMRSVHRNGFTLIEVLVVVAIIALLIAILLPSLNSARKEARAVACQSNVRHLAMAFIAYSVENQGRLPGTRRDINADWLGGSNGAIRRPDGTWDYSRMVYGPDNNQGKQPEWGTIYKKHMGGMIQAYQCPEDDVPREPGQFTYSYTANGLLSGARTEALAGAHYPLPLNATYPDFDRDDHTTEMQPFDGVPMIIEEHPRFYLLAEPDSAWCNEDVLSDRHGSQRTRMGGRCSIGFVDGHAGPARVPRVPSGENDFVTPGTLLKARSICIRLTGRKWISGRNWSEAGMYGLLDTAAPASDFNVKHFP